MRQTLLRLLIFEPTTQPSPIDIFEAEKNFHDGRPMTKSYSEVVGEPFAPLAPSIGCR